MRLLKISLHVAEAKRPHHQHPRVGEGQEYDEGENQADMQIILDGATKPVFPPMHL